MKKIVLSVIIVVMAFVACHAQNGYKVVGNIEYPRNGKMILATVEKDSKDTLSRSDLVDGAFTFTGKIEGIMAAYIFVLGEKGGVPIILENTIFSVNIGLRDFTVKGGEGQKLLNQFYDLDEEVSRLSNSLYPLVKVAKEFQNQGKIDSVSRLITRAMEIAEAKSLEFIGKNPDTYVAAFMLRSKMRQMNLDTLKQLYVSLGNNAKATKPGEAIAARIAELEVVGVNQIAPNFTLMTPEGEELSLYDVKGKIKLIDFWASWCSPCRKENPHIVNIYKDFHAKGLEIISVSLDQDKTKWEKAIADDCLTWNHVSDLKGWDSFVVPLYVISGIPHTVLLDENNKIIATNLKGDKLRQKMVDLLK